MKINIQKGPRITRIRHLKMADMFVREGIDDAVYVVYGVGSTSVNAVKVRSDKSDNDPYFTFSFGTQEPMPIRLVKTIDVELE